MSVPQAWLKRPDESDQAYAAFEFFRDQGPERSMIYAYHAHVRANGGTKGPSKKKGAARTLPKQVPGTWKRWKKQHDWQQRAEAFDRRSSAYDPGEAERHAIASQAVQSAAYDIAAEGVHQIIARYLANLDNLAATANRALGRVNELLALPVTEIQEKEGLDGETLVIHVPAESKHFTAAATLLRAAASVHTSSAADIMALVLNRKIEPVGSPDDEYGEAPKIVYVEPDGVEELRAEVANRGHGPSQVALPAPTGESEA